MATKILRCYAHGHEGIWEGICVDLDIAVTGVSFDEVRERLHQSIVTYVEDATNEDPLNAQRLLNRKAPLHVRVSYAAKAWLARRRGSHNDNDVYAGFDVPCHA